VPGWWIKIPEKNYNLLEEKKLLYMRGPLRSTNKVRVWNIVLLNYGSTKGVFVL
jgi:hypothetical protein